MTIREPLAFMSYVRTDDAHDGGKITRFRERLEGEIRMQTGSPFPIFQDRNDIDWGQRWAERIEDTLASVTYLIPVLTPSFFLSPACRDEFQAFLLREKTIGVPRLILPLYYVQCDQLETDAPRNLDAIADVLRDRNWTDWRALRFKPFDDEEVARALAKMAGMIKSSTKDLNGLIAASNADEERATAAALVLEPEPSHPPAVVVSYELPEARSAGQQFDKVLFEHITSTEAYYAYTRRYDEVIAAQNLADQSEVMALWNSLTRYIEAAKKKHKAEADRLAAAALNTTPDLSVTLLVDNSGSLRGKPILQLAGSVVVVAEALDRIGLRVEVLGYTTRTWRGGQSRELWLSDGSPSNPGRLNDLRHIVYKSFDETTTSALPNFCIMTRPGLIKENIDGEALLWAHSRLAPEGMAHKHLFLMSDGKPVDDATLGANQTNFLERHLIATIATIRQDPSIYLAAVGLGTDLSRHFGETSFAVKDIDAAGVPILRSIAAALKKSSGDDRLPDLRG